jgi:hypothetical protein
MLSYLPPGAMPVQEHLENGADANRDGHGYALVIPGRKNAGRGELVTGRSMNPAEAIDDFMWLRDKYPDGPAMFHSRIGTGGTYTVDNCHPFHITPRTVVGHNGILFFPDKDEERSDTKIFAQEIFPRQFRRLDRPGVQQALTAYLGGAHNKMLFLTVDPRYVRTAYLFGEKHGQWVANDERVWGKGPVPDGAIWHSNAGWQPVKTWKSGGAYANWDYSGWMLQKESTIPAAQRDDCMFCRAAGSVSRADGVCSECMTCADCATVVWDCMCWMPRKQREEELS